MSNKKGRKHRSVNRTPRPVAPAVQRSERVVSRLGWVDAEPNLDRVLSNLGFKKVPPQPSISSAARDLGSFTESFEPAGPIFYNKARDGGLGHHAQRTWARLKEVGTRGATVEDLCEAVGYQARTITKHLEGLSHYGLAEQREDGRWASTGKSQWAAAKEHDVPDRWAKDRERVLGRVLQ
ncbi:hypothetical protein [Streptomyces hypolithicus]